MLAHDAPPLYFIEKEPSTAFLLSKLSRKWDEEDTLLTNAAMGEIAQLTNETEEIIANLREKLKADISKEEAKLAQNLSRQHAIRSCQIDRVASNQFYDRPPKNFWSWPW